MEVSDYTKIAKKHDYIRICSLNMREANPDNLIMDQLKQICTINPDIIVLAEYNHSSLSRDSATDDVIKCLYEDLTKLTYNYTIVNVTRSHAGFIALIVKTTAFNNPDNPEISQDHVPNDMYSGYCGANLILKYGNVIVIAVHLEPHKYGCMYRYSALEHISTGSDKIPCIIVGDYNMRDNEDKHIHKLGLQDAYKYDESYYATWPNRLCETDKYVKNINTDLRFDRITYRKCVSENFRTINTYHSNM